MTAVVIRAMTEAIKGEGEEKGKGSKEKEGIGYIVSIWIHISVSCLRVYAFFSFFFFWHAFQEQNRTPWGLVFVSPYIYIYKEGFTLSWIYGDA